MWGSQYDYWSGSPRSRKEKRKLKGNGGGMVGCTDTCEEPGCDEKCTAQHKEGCKRRTHTHYTAGGRHVWTTMAETVK